MGLQVLLVEDDAVLADGLTRALQAQGMQVTLARDGLGADQLLQDAAAASSQAPDAAAPDVVVLDIGLPGIDGYEVARRLRKNGNTRHIKLIALTGYGLAEDQRRVLEAGFDMHLVKPVDINHLLEAITQCATLPAD